MRAGGIRNCSRGTLKPRQVALLAGPGSPLPRGAWELRFPSASSPCPGRSPGPPRGRSPGPGRCQCRCRCGAARRHQRVGAPGCGRVKAHQPGELLVPTCPSAALGHYSWLGVCFCLGPLNCAAFETFFSAVRILQGKQKSLAHLSVLAFEHAV